MTRYEAEKAIIEALKADHRGYAYAYDVLHAYNKPFFEKIIGLEADLDMMIEFSPDYGGFYAGK